MPTLTRLQRLAPTIGCAAVLAAQPVLFFRHTLVDKTTHIPWDLPAFHAALVSVVVEALQEGRLPLWDPYTYAGYPLHADVAAQLFYPPAWLVFLLSGLQEHAIVYWLEWFVALHLVLAGAGAWWLLRRLECGRGAALFGATAFQLGCFFASQAQHTGAVAGAAWMPFAWLGVVTLAGGFTRRRFALLAAALAMIFLAGFPAITLVAYASTAAVALGFARLNRSSRLLLSVGAALLAAALLCAVQLMPTLLNSPASAASQRWQYAVPEGVTPRALIGAVWPDYLHVFTPFDPTKFREPGNFTFLYFYNGQLAAWLALAALFLRERRARLFAAVAGLSLLVLCGGGLPGYSALFYALPRIVRSAAYIEFTLAAYSLAGAVAAALALQKLAGRRSGLTVALALATGLELLLVASNRPMNTEPGSWKQLDSTRQMMAQPGLLSAARSLVNQTQPPARIDTDRPGPRFTSEAPLLRLPSASGDNPFAPRRMLAYRALFAHVIPWARQYPIEKLDSPLIGAANVAFLLHPGLPLDDARMEAAGWTRIPALRDPSLLVYRNLRVLPRYRFVDRVIPARDMEAALYFLPGLDPAAAAVVEGEAPMAEPGPPGSVQVVDYAADEIDLRVESAHPAWLVAAEGYASGWKATIDGVPAPLLPTNVAFMGMQVPAGAHRVRLAYRPAWLAWWALLSVLAWLLLAASCFPLWQRSQPSATAKSLI